MSTEHLVSNWRLALLGLAIMGLLAMPMSSSAGVSTSASSCSAEHPCDMECMWTGAGFCQSANTGGWYPQYVCSQSSEGGV